MIILACIDGGLFCIPSMIILGLLALIFPPLGIWLRKKFSWCKKKSCHCNCHDSKGSKKKKRVFFEF